MTEADISLLRNFEEYEIWYTPYNECISHLFDPLFLQSAQQSNLLLPFRKIFNDCYGRESDRVDRFPYKVETGHSGPLKKNLTEPASALSATRFALRNKALVILSGRNFSRPDRSPVTCLQAKGSDFVYTVHAVKGE